MTNRGVTYGTREGERMCYLNYNINFRRRRLFIPYRAPIISRHAKIYALIILDHDLSPDFRCCLYLLMRDLNFCGNYRMYAMCAYILHTLGIFVVYRVYLSYGTLGTMYQTSKLRHSEDEDDPPECIHRSLRRGRCSDISQKREFISY